MASFITGPDPNAATWPILCKPVSSGLTSGLNRVSGDALVGSGSYPTILSDGLDTNYIWEKGATSYYAINCASFNLPLNARVTSATPAIRGRMHSGNTIRHDALVVLSDHSDVGGKNAIAGSTVHFQLGSTFQTFNGPSRYTNRNGKLYSQADLAAGISITFGLNNSYGSNGGAGFGADWSQASIKYTYDLPPTANITFPTSGSGTITNTAAPIITWDYFDDFQPQSKYQVNLVNSLGVKVYDSGLVVSSSTFHAVTTPLPNDTYTVNLRVYQAWNLLGGDFKATNLATSSFTLSALTLGTPRLTAAAVNEHAEVTVYPDINLISFDGSTMDNGLLGWYYTQSGCTVATTGSPVKDGSNSLAITVSATASPFVGANPEEIPVTTGNQFKLQAYLNPVALAGRSGQVGCRFLDANGTVLSSAFGPSTSLPSNQWTQVSATGMIAPSGAFWMQPLVMLAGVSVADVICMDDAGAWWHVDTAVLPTWSRGGFFEQTINLITYADSTIDNNNVWAIDPTAPNTGLSISSAQARHGSQSLNLTYSATGNGTCQTMLSNNFIPVTAAGNLRMVAWGLSSTNTRNASIGCYWYKGDFTASATAFSFAATGASTTGVWTRFAGNMVVPTDAVYAIPWMNYASVPQNEQKYYDAISLYPVQPGSLTQDFVRGFYPSTDSQPTMLVEYSDDFVNWKTLLSQPVYEALGSYVIKDYTIKSNIAGNLRYYRASLFQVENGIQLASPYSNTASINLTLSQVWMHLDSDPAGTSYNFKWDGGGRAETQDAAAAMTPVEGRPYPVASFAVQSVGSIDVTLHLDVQNDISTLLNMAKSNGLVVFRDQRGRSYRGVIGAVKFADGQYGVVQDATFTLVLAGDQP